MTQLSVIITTCNRANDLKQTLMSLLQQNTNGFFTFDVIVADNNSKDHTKEVIQDLMPHFKGKLQYIFESQQGKTHAINKLIKLCKSEIIVSTDDDVLIAPDWLLNIVECFQTYNCDVVGGRVLPQYPQDTPQWVKDNADLLSGPIVKYDYGETIKPYCKPMYEFLGANIAYKRSLFEEYGFYRTDLGPGTGITGDDTEICSRFYKAGKKLYYCGPALVWHPVEKSRMTLRYIAKSFISLGRYRIVIDEKNEIPKNIVYIAGIPRYLIVQMIKKSSALLLNLFNKRSFLKIWIDLSISFGKAKEIRNIYQSQLKRNRL